MNRVTCPYCSRSGISVSRRVGSAACPECSLIFGVEVYAIALSESERKHGPEKPPGQPRRPRAKTPEQAKANRAARNKEAARKRSEECKAKRKEWARALRQRRMAAGMRADGKPRKRGGAKVAKPGRKP